jgi:hypothetical protein
MNSGLNSHKELAATGDLNTDERSFRERQQRLEDVDRVLADSQNIWREQLDELIRLLGIRVKVNTSTETGNRQTTLAVQSQKAHFDVKFAVFEDEDVRNVTFLNDIQVTPSSPEHDSRDELTFAVTDIDKEKLSNWIFHRILVFKKAYIDLHQK